jgi:hypothetical protein
MSYVFMRRAAMLVAAATLAACANTPEPAMTPSPSGSATSGSGWRSLFDGRTLAGWHVYHESGTPKNWAVVDGTIQRMADGGDLVTDEMYANFELELDWKIVPGGNSGILYRVNDSGEETYFTGPEMQVLDDARHPDGKNPLTSAGSDYGLYPAPRGVVKPVGEWNHVRLVVNGNHVEHWLNGVKVVEYELHSPDWNAKVAASKFAQWPGYGMSPTGRIALQQHGAQVNYRNIRIKVLP